MNNLENYNETVFEKIKRINDEGREYWSARDLMNVLEYIEWRKFDKTIEKAIYACKSSSNKYYDHFVGADKMVGIGSKTKRKIKDYYLSRYACYLIVQNSDPRKEVVALGQTYFAIQTRKQELTEAEYSKLSETDRRLYVRRQTKDKNMLLYQIAKKAGVKNFDKFTNAGYKGLYNGETADDIAKRKGLRYREEILDNMGSEELGNNLFRIIQTESKIKNQNIKGEKNASDAHFVVGQIVRETIIKVGGTLPEILPIPDRSLKDIEKKQ